MAEGDEDPKVDLKTFWPEFMIEMLRATGRYEVVSLDMASVSGPDEHGHLPATSTPLGGRGDSVPSEFSLLGHTYRKIPPPVPKRESSRLVVHRTTSIESPKSPILKPPRPPLPEDYPLHPHIHFQDEVEPNPLLNTNKKDSTSLPPPAFTKTEPGGDLPKFSTVPSFNIHPSAFDRSLNSSYLASMRLPQLPFFSGEDQKGDVSFEVWKFELCCLIRENYPDSLILQSIRKNLRGKARETLLTLGETAKPSDILNKLEGIYGNVSTNEVLLQQFYIECQRKDEAVADYSIRIENLLRRATRSRTISDEIRNEMLCSKLWNGLRDPLLKNSSRYTYGTEKDFNQFRKKLRSIEQDLSVFSLTNSLTSSAADSQLLTSGDKETVDVKQMQQSTSDSNSTDKKLDGLLQQMKLLRERMDSLENKFKDATLKTSTSSTTTVPSSVTSQRGYTARGRGGSYRGIYNFRKGQYNKRETNQQQQSVSDKHTETTTSSPASVNKTDKSPSPLN